MSKTIGLPNQILKFVFQTKFMQDMDEQEANAKLVLGTITFPNQMQNFPPKLNACRTWMSRRQTRNWFYRDFHFSKPYAKFFLQTKYMQDIDKRRKR
jgi:hypothetical protein